MSCIYDPDETGLGLYVGGLKEFKHYRCTVAAVKIDQNGDEILYLDENNWIDFVPTVYVGDDVLACYDYGEVTFYGYGEMYDAETWGDSGYPWIANLRDDITKVIVGDGITALPEGVLSGCTGLKTVQLPSSLTYIPQDAFDGCYALESIEMPDNGIYRSEDGILYHFDGNEWSPYIVPALLDVLLEEYYETEFETEEEEEAEQTKSIAAEPSSEENTDTAADEVISPTA